MIRRRLVREFPVFFVYTVYQIVQEGTLFVLDHAMRGHLVAVPPYRYWHAYWAFMVVSSALRFALIYEIFFHILQSYRGLWELSRLLFRWVAALLLLVAVVISAYAPANDPYRFHTGVYVVNRAVSLVQTGLLVFLFLFSSYFHLSWRSYVCGIALGLGIFSSVDLATSAMRASIGPAPGNYVYDFIVMGTYHCSVLIWLAYLLAPEYSRRMVKELPADDLERWNAELQRLLLQ